MQKSSCAWEQAAVIYLVARGLPRDATGMSSNGRTADSGSVNGGSTPSIPAIMARSSSGLGRRPLKAEITSSNLVRATNDCKAPTSVGAFSYASASCKPNRLSPRPGTARPAQSPPRWPERNHPHHSGETHCTRVIAHALSEWVLARHVARGAQAKALLTQKRVRAKLARTRSTLLQAYAIPWPRRP